MRDMLHRASRRRSLFLAATAIPVSLATAAALAPAAGAQSAIPGSSGSSLTDSIAPSGGEPVRSPVRTEYPQIDGLPEGVSIDHVDWLTNRRIAIYLSLIHI